MGLFKNTTDALFRQTEDGKTIYYGKGLLKKGYILDSEEKKEKIYKYHKSINTFIVPLGIVYALFVGLAGAPFLGIIPILLVGLILYFKQKKLIKNLPVYEEKLTLAETKKSMVSIFPKWFTIFMMIIGTLTIAMALMLPFTLDENTEEIGATMGLLLIMGMPLLGIGWYLYKNREKALK